MASGPSQPLSAQAEGSRHHLPVTQHRDNQGPPNTGQRVLSQALLQNTDTAQAPGTQHGVGNPELPSLQRLSLPDPTRQREEGSSPAFWNPEIPL